MFCRWTSYFIHFVLTIEKKNLHQILRSSSLKSLFFKINITYLWLAFYWSLLVKLRLYAFVLLGTLPQTILYLLLDLLKELLLWISAFNRRPIWGTIIVGIHMVYTDLTVVDKRLSREILTIFHSDTLHSLPTSALLIHILVLLHL